MSENARFFSKVYTEFIKVKTSRFVYFDTNFLWKFTQYDKTYNWTSYIDLTLNKILIAEDDVFISEHLKQILINLGYQVYGIASSYTMALEIVDNSDLPDLALLDIRMHNEDQGIRIAEHFKNINVPFVYITSFSDKKTLEEAIVHQPLGYILKPFTTDEINKVLETIFKKLSPEYIIIKDKSIKKKIYFNAIKYIKSDNNYIEIYTTTKTYVDRLKLSDLESILPQAIFIRTHRSYIVNKNFVDDFGYNELKIGDEIIPVSRQYKNNVDFLTD